MCKEVIVHTVLTEEALIASSTKGSGPWKSFHGGTWTCCHTQSTKDYTDISLFVGSFTFFSSLLIAWFLVLENKDDPSSIWSKPFSSPDNAHTCYYSSWFEQKVRSPPASLPRNHHGEINFQDEQQTHLTACELAGYPQGLWILRLILDLVASVGGLHSHKRHGLQDWKFQNSLPTCSFAGSL